MHWKIQAEPIFSLKCCFDIMLRVSDVRAELLSLEVQDKLAVLFSAPVSQPLDSRLLNTSPELEGQQDDEPTAVENNVDERSDAVALAAAISRPKMITTYVSPEDSKLETIKHLEDVYQHVRMRLPHFVNTLIPSTEEKSQQTSLLMGRTNVKASTHTSLLESRHPEAASISTSEVVLSVAIYHPLKEDEKSQEFLVLSSQPLTALRDALHCPLQSSIDSVSSRSEDPSYFFIEGVFYNDKRRAKVEYSKEIIEWSQNQKLRLQSGHLLDAPATADMSTATFDDLYIRMHAQYVFVHLGMCEHIVKFTEVRLHHPRDPQLRSEYPHKIFQGWQHRRFCQVCAIRPAKLLLIEDPLAFENPFAVCKECAEHLQRGRGVGLNVVEI